MTLLSRLRDFLTGHAGKPLASRRERRRAARAQGREWHARRGRGSRFGIGTSGAACVGHPWLDGNDHGHGGGGFGGGDGGGGGGGGDGGGE